MITFKQFITEARLAPLYHGTNASKLESLITNGFRPVTLQAADKLMMNGANTTKAKDGGELVGYYQGVSLTRNKKFAMQWSQEHEISIVLELDQQKLAQKYKIKPIQFWRGISRSKESLQTNRLYNEYEEFVVTDKPIPFKHAYRSETEESIILKNNKPIPLKKYAIKVLLPGLDIESLKRNFNKGDKSNIALLLNTSFVKE